MTGRLNIKQLKIYNSYRGDIDGICRNNRTAEITVFEDNLESTWAFISSKLQDIKLISTQLTSFDYTKNTLTELYERSDTETYEVLTGKIPFYNDFQKVKQILEIIKGWTTHKTDTIWGGYDNGKEFLVDLNADIEKIKFCDFETLNKLNIEFAPTSTYQEISLSNGWGNEFIKLAGQFDKLYEKIKRRERSGNFDRKGKC